MSIWDDIKNALALRDRFFRLQTGLITSLDMPLYSTDDEILQYAQRVYRANDRVESLGRFTCVERRDWQALHAEICQLTGLPGDKVHMHDTVYLIPVGLEIWELYEPIAYEKLHRHYQIPNDGRDCEDLAKRCVSNFKFSLDDEYSKYSIGDASVDTKGGVNHATNIVLSYLDSRLAFRFIDSTPRASWLWGEVSMPPRGVFDISAWKSLTELWV